MTRWLSSMCVALLGCASRHPVDVAPVAVDVSADSVEAPEEEAPRAGAAQPVEAPPELVDLARLSIDLARLPLSEEPTPSMERVNVATDLAEVSTVLARGLIAEIEVGYTRLYTHSPASPFGPSLEGQGKPRQIFRGICHELRSGPLRWRGFRADTVTAETLDFVEYRGSYDSRACAGVATSRRASKAVAIVPGVLYAFRTCVENCDPVTPLRRRESVTLIGPPSRVVLESSAELDEITYPHLGSFSVTDIPVDPEEIGTVSLNLPTGPLERSGTVDPARLLGAAATRVDVEVRGGKGHTPGELNIFVAAFPGRPPQAPSAPPLGPDALARAVRFPGAAP